MLILHLRRHFRPRSTEWLVAVLQVSWGVSVLRAPGAFDAPVYALLLNIATPRAWGVGLVLFGLCRLVVLVINGAWRPSPYVRLLLSLISVLWGVQMVLSLVATGWSAPAFAFAPAVILFDTLNIMHTADDAGSVGRDARHR